MNLIEQEHVVLSICAEGEDILAMGNWKDAVLSLWAQGMLKQKGEAYVITDLGRKKFQDIEEAEIESGFLGSEEAEDAEDDASLQ